MRKVFISYSSINAADIDVLAADIKSLGHEVWVDHELSGGQRWWDYILQQIAASDAFVFAVSANSVDSQACLRELGYAEALGKPIVPITIERDFSDSLLPQTLSQLHRVNYTTQDKAAFASLNRALSTLPDAPPLPAELPPAPPVPGTYLFDLKEEIDASGTMSGERQAELVTELRSRLVAGHRKEDLLALAQRFRQRQDLLKRTDGELEAFEAQLRSETSSGTGGRGPASAAREQTTAYEATPSGSTTGPGYAASEPPPPYEPVSQARQPYQQPTSTGQGEKPVPGWWWAVVIIFNWLGGLIAWAVNKDASPKAAKNLLITGIAVAVVWIFIFGSYGY